MGFREMGPSLERGEPQELDERLDSQRAGHDGILVEMGLEKPLRRVHLFHAPDEAQSLGSAVRNVQVDPVHVQQGFGGHGKRAVDRFRPFSPLFQRGAGGDFFSQRNQRVIHRFHRRNDFQIECLPPGGFRLVRNVCLGVRAGEADLIGQGLFREKPEIGRSLVHRLAVFQHDHVEILDDHAARLGGFGHSAPDGERSAPGIKVPMERRLAAEISEFQVLMGPKRGANIGRQKTARLERDFQQHAIGHDPASIRSEIPSVRGNLILGFDPPAGFEHPRLRLGGNHPIHEKIGRSRQPCDPPLLIKHPVRRPKTFRGIPLAKCQELLAGKTRHFHRNRPGFFRSRLPRLGILLAGLPETRLHAGTMGVLNPGFWLLTSNFRLPTSDF